MSEKKVDAELEKLCATYGNDIVSFRHGGKLFAFKTPELDAFEDYQQRLAKGDRRGVCHRELAQRCLVSPVANGAPDLEALSKVFEAKPALTVSLSNALYDLAGAEIEVVVGKG